MGAGARRWIDPLTGAPRYPDGSVVEIRVHGVGGAPPSEMTGDPHPVRVAGNDTVGFYRAKDPVVQHLDDEPSSDGERPVHAREALAWGGQTSGTWRHAFWILLLPFALFNVAGRMHVPDDPVRAGWHRAICRVLAVTLTLTVMALTAGIAFDLLVVQCGTLAAGCAEQEGLAGLLLAPVRLAGDSLLARLAMATSMPILLLLALWYAGRYRTGELEGAATGPTGPVRPAGEAVSLGDPDIWRNAWPTSRLRGLHGSAAFAWIGMTLALAVGAVLSSGETAWVWVWRALAVVGASVLLRALLLVVRPAIAIPGPDPELRGQLARLRFGAMTVLGGGIGLAASAGAAVRPPGGWGIAGGATLGGLGLVLVGRWVLRSVRAASGGGRERPDISITRANAGLALGWVVLSLGVGMLVEPPRIVSTLAVDGGLLAGLFAGPYRPLFVLALVQVVLVVGLVWVSAARQVPVRADASPLDDGSPIPWHQSATVVTLLSLLAVTAVGTGLHAMVLAIVTDGSLVLAVDRPRGELVLPWWLGLTALVVLTVGLVLALAAWALVRRLRRGAAPSTQTVRADLDAAYAGAGLAVTGSGKDDEDRLAGVAGGWTTQALLRGAGRPLAWAVGVAVAGVAILGAVSVVWPSLWDREIPLVAPALFLLSVVPLGGVWAIRRGLRDRQARRDIGRLWDVLTFWPRITHPFAPPCYAEALVPMLRRRVELLRGLEPLPWAPGSDPAPGAQGEGRGVAVILAGHSQGSVIAFAAAAQIRASADHPPGVALVTYGSPIAILYERFFRGAFTSGSSGDAEDDVRDPTTTLYSQVRARVATWHHLFALTEPFAMPFWDEHVVEASPADRARGWPVTLGLPDLHAASQAATAPSQLRAGNTFEALVRDPSRWLAADGSRSVPLGHSCYHDHPDVEQHLERIARGIRAGS